MFDLNELITQVKNTGGDKNEFKKIIEAYKAKALNTDNEIKNKAQITADEHEAAIRAIFNQ